MNDVSKTLLGKSTDYSQTYSPDLLFPLARQQNRQTLELGENLPFQGEDIWTGYELSWLNNKGKPQVAIADFHFPASSPHMIESKSFKLYLNSLNHEVFKEHEALVQVLEKDLTTAAGAPVSVVLHNVNVPMLTTANSETWLCLDELDITCQDYTPNPELLSFRNEPVSERLYSNLLRSNCPVTGQPDWASIYISYSGPQIDHESLLKYLVSFRQCQDFHEHCVERIFTDLMRVCGCRSLSVYARYTRRGGLDINPYRATPDLSAKAPLFRTPRQ